jgi:hypothetical protein
MELDQIEIVASTPDELVLRIPAFPDEGLEAESVLRAGIIRELGEYDGELLWRFMGPAPEPPYTRDYWHGFGRVSRQLSFRLEPWERSPNELLLHFSSETPAEESTFWFLEERRQLGSFSTVSRFPTRETLGRFEYLLPLLPEAIANRIGPSGGEK